MFARLLISLVLVVSATEAAIVDRLYEAEVLVQSQSRSERDQAMSRALAQVFQKVSGRADASALPGIADAISKADRYLQQYLYRGLQETQYPIPQANPSSQIAWFRFDEQAVNSVLRDNGLAVWGRTRPATLVWLGVEENGSRYMLGSDSAEELRDILEYEAQRQGMALVLPLLDLQDQRTLSFADLWGDFQDSIMNASNRYQAEAVLVGRVSLTSSDVWQARWTLYESGRSYSWQSQGTYADEALSSGIAGTVGKLAERYAQAYSEDNPGVVLLAINGVTSLKDYAKVSSYLNSLELVKDIQPSVISNNSAQFRLNIRGNAEGLAQTIKLGNVLQQEHIAIESPVMNASPGANFFGVPSTFTAPVQAQSPDYTYRLMP
ncbi:MAG: hypothetical protein AMJ53_15710 [Gammaproteobacteria bacterium SG8_11]|nr:MAG: hypothetical protein AMJ53_15710 [Gammaproteobacteria bacterium SG8_11]